MIVPEGKIATGKLAQALMHGARVIALRGNFDQALELVRELVRAAPDRARQLASTSSASRARRPRRSRSLEELGGDVDALCIPVGNAGNITAYWKGFVEAGAAPAMFGFQAEGAAPLVTGSASRSPRRSRARSGSATRRAGRRRWPR